MVRMNGRYETTRSLGRWWQGTTASPGREHHLSGQVIRALTRPKERARQAKLCIGLASDREIRSVARAAVTLSVCTAWTVAVAAFGRGDEDRRPVGTVARILPASHAVSPGDDGTGGWRHAQCCVRRVATCHGERGRGTGTARGRRLSAGRPAVRRHLGSRPAGIRCSGHVTILSLQSTRWEGRPSMMNRWLAPGWRTRPKA